MIVGTDILIVTVLHAESLRDDAQLYEAQTLVEVAGMDIGSHHGIELHNTKAMSLTLYETIGYQLFADMETSVIPADCVAGITDVAAATDIIWMQNIETTDLSGIDILSYGIVGLNRKKIFSCLQC